jgi:hypothetical protein
MPPIPEPWTAALPRQLAGSRRARRDDGCRRVRAGAVDRRLLLRTRGADAVQVRRGVAVAPPRRRLVVDVVHDTARIGGATGGEIVPGRQTRGVVALAILRVGRAAPRAPRAAARRAVRRCRSSRGAALAPSPSASPCRSAVRRRGARRRGTSLSGGRAGSAATQSARERDEQPPGQVGESRSHGGDSERNAFPTSSGVWPRERCKPLHDRGRPVNDRGEPVHDYGEPGMTAATPLFPAPTLLFSAPTPLLNEPLGKRASEYGTHYLV